MSTEFQSPRGDFGFLKVVSGAECTQRASAMFQSPRGDFGFLKTPVFDVAEVTALQSVSIPSRGFWFFEDYNRWLAAVWAVVSIPSRGFWFFEGLTTAIG